MRRVIVSGIAFGAYPVLLGSGLLGYAALLAAGLEVTPAGLIPVLMAGLLVTALETCLPHRHEWRPQAREVGTDLWFMAITQGLVPKLLGLVLVVALAGTAAAADTPFPSIWPHHWPLAAQTVVLLLGIDFISYWVHRAMHRIPGLWRLHAVHHSPERLYWLNVGRFHPLEKALQLVASSLPFLLLGVSPVVFGGYFVFYAINGFVQHSNAGLRFGPLNYLVSSPELHRWHHSVEIAESDRNFGNNLIIWDLLFGTWFLPRGRQVHRLGIRMDYPASFNGLLAAPFKGLRRTMERLALKHAMRLIQLTHRRRLEQATRDPGARQQAVLRGILRLNSDSDFGAQHGFNGIDSYTAFRAAVPVQDHALLQPFIDEQRRTGRPALTGEPPGRYLQTSGTAGTPKLIPVLESTERRWRAHQHLLALAQYRRCPAAFDGSLLSIVGPVVEHRLEGGVTVGSMSGVLYEQLPALLRRRAVLPPEVAAIPDYALRYRTILRLALAESDITLLASPNPSTFLRLLELFESERQDLIESVASGTWDLPDHLDPAIGKAVSARLRADPARAAALRALGPQPALGDVWPELRMIATWTGGSCGMALEALRRRLPGDAVIFDLGYVASELRGTLPLGDAQDGLPDLEHVFYEFVEREAWDRGEPDYLTVEQLQSGCGYYLIVTTPDGLYRYFMNDVLRVTGFHNRTPRLRFLQKGRGVTNITGEKVSETQVLEAVQEAERRLGFASCFFTMLADEQAAAYRLLLEPAGRLPCSVTGLADRIDQSLRHLNIEYAAKRDSGRLRSLRVEMLRPGTGEACKLASIARGQRESQYKPAALQYASSCGFAFDEHLDRSSGDDHP